VLDEQEQIVFRRLSAFYDGCSLEAAEAVCSTGLSENIFGIIESLVNKRLVHSTEGLDGMPRFRMLETLREYARARLADSGETEMIERQQIIAPGDGAVQRPVSRMQVLRATDQKLKAVSQTGTSAESA
jgi:predicted ATPase